MFIIYLPIFMKQLIKILCRLSSELPKNICQILIYQINIFLLLMKISWLPLNPSQKSHYIFRVFLISTLLTPPLRISIKKWYFNLQFHSWLGSCRSIFAKSMLIRIKEIIFFICNFRRPQYLGDSKNRFKMDSWNSTSVFLA